MKNKGLDRYKTFVSIRERPKYKDTYIIDELDPIKGSRTTQVNSQTGAIVRTDYSDIGKQTSSKKLVEECSGSPVFNPGYSNMIGRPTGHRHDPNGGWDDYDCYGPSGHRH